MTRRIEIQISQQAHSRTLTVASQLYIDRTSISVARFNIRAHNISRLELGAAELHDVAQAVVNVAEAWDPMLPDGRPF